MNTYIVIYLLSNAAVWPRPYSHWSSVRKLVTSKSYASRMQVKLLRKYTVIVRNIIGSLATAALQYIP